MSESGLALSCVMVGVATGADSNARQGVGVFSTTLGVLLIVGLFYHAVAFALNEIIDLPIDRTNPGRTHAVLVSGRANVPGAWVAVCGFAVVSYSFDLVRFGYGTVALCCLTGGYVALIGYDLLTKRSRWPVAHDLLLALGCAALVCYAAERTGGLTSYTLLASTYVALFVVLVNGVHGGLRDLHNDLRHSGITTASALGARIGEGGGLLLPRPLVAYAWALNSAMVVVAVVAALSAPAVDGGQSVVAGGAIIASAGGIIALAHGLRCRQDLMRFRRIGLAHMLVAYSPVMFIAALDGGWRMGVAAAVVMMAPLATNPRFRSAWGASLAKARRRVRTHTN